jgi:hypothetical protein
MIINDYILAHPVLSAVVALSAIMLPLRLWVMFCSSWTLRRLREEVEQKQRRFVDLNVSVNELGIEAKHWQTLHTEISKLSPIEQAKWIAALRRQSDSA